MKKEKVQEELSDIIEMIHRYVASNKGKVCFIADFWAFDEEKMKKNKQDITKDGSDRVCIFGDKETLRMMLNCLRDIVEEEANKDGFVSI